jgi:predicted MFS family arabinose efflux permease
LDGERQRTAPREGIGTRLSVLLAVACGTSVANVYSAQPLLGRIGADLRMGSGELGLVTTVIQIGYLLGLVLIVPLADLVDRRRMIVVQVLTACGGLVAIGLARDAAVYFAAAAVVGLVSVVVQVIVAYAAVLSTPERRGRVVGTVTSGVVLGVLLARTASGLIADLFGWRAVFFISAAQMLALAAALAKLLPRDRRHQDRWHRDGQPRDRWPKPRARVPYARLITSVFTLTARNRTFLVRSLLGLFMFGGFGVVWGSVALPLAAAPWHLPPGRIGLFGIAGAAGALAAARAGRLADRGRAQWVTGASLVLLLASWPAIRAATHSLVLLAVGVVILDFAGQALHVTNQHLIVETDPAASGRIIGSYMVYYSLGIGGGAIAATSLYGVAGWGAVSILGASLSGLGLLVWGLDRLLPRRQERRNTEPEPVAVSAPPISSLASERR